MSKSNKIILIKIIKSDDLSKFKLLSNELLTDMNEVINVKSGDNSLHLCSIFNSIKIIEYLLIDCMNQIDVNFRNKEDKSALHISSQYGHKRCLQLLLNTNQVNIDCLKRSDWSPLMLALTKDNLEIIELLVENNANQSLRNKDGWNGFHIAVRSGHLVIIEYLLKCDKKVWKTKSNTNRTPLHTACLSANHSIVEFLINNCQYSCDETDSCGSTPFMESVRSDSVQICRLLVEKQNINPLLTDILGRNALHISSEAKAMNCVKYLVEELKFDINSVTTVGQMTALHFAAKEGHYETIELLLRLKANKSLRDSKQRTPYDISKTFKHNNCSNLLKL